MAKSSLMSNAHSIWNDFVHLFYPQICAGCGSDAISSDSPLCIRCIASLPLTNFHLHTGNQVEKIFWGRIPVTYATSLCYFNTGSLIQTVLHQIKYKGHKELGYFMGRIMGETLMQANRFSYVDALIPLPLFAAREKKRGYNQAALLCEGMAELMKIPVWVDVVRRTKATSTQTKKTRLERWENMEDKFVIDRPSLLTGKHVLLVDDVITTGATLEACGGLMLQLPEVKVSIATLAYTIK